MRIACVDLKFPEHLTSQSVLGQHAAYGCFHRISGMASDHFRIRDLFKAAGVTGMMAVKFIGHFFTRNYDFIGVKDDNEISGVLIRRILGLVLTGK